MMNKVHLFGFEDALRWFREEYSIHDFFIDTFTMTCGSSGGYKVDVLLRGRIQEHDNIHFAFKFSSRIIRIFQPVNMIPAAAYDGSVKKLAKNYRRKYIKRAGKDMKIRVLL